MRLVVANIILVVVLFAGCKKEPKYYYFKDQRIRDALNIKESSYFIYRDSTNAEIDTVVMGILSNYFAEKQDYGDDKFETLWAGAKYSSLGTRYRIGAWAFTRDTDKISGFIGSPNSYDVEILELPFTKNKTFFPYGDKIVKYVNYYPSFTLNNNMYEDVYEVTTSSIEEQFYFRSYFSLKSGLVKYAIQKGNSYHSYELIDYKIIR